MKLRTVLSLFNGMSCGQIALYKLGYEYESYYSSEIDTHAIKVTQHNYPHTLQIGDVTKWRDWDIDWARVDLLLAGSPCQGFSFAGKQLAFNDPRSALVFVFVEIWNHVKIHNPKAFYILENVRMKKEHELVISSFLNINPIVINSALVSAQNRVRLYWTNIYNKPIGMFGDLECMIPQPEDKGILLRDVLESEVSVKYYLSDKMSKYFSKSFANFNQGKVNIRDFDDKASTLTSSMSSCDISDNFICIDSGGRIDDRKTGTLVSTYYKGVEKKFGSRPFILNTKLKLSDNQNKANCFTAGGNSAGLHSDMTLIVASRGRGDNNDQQNRVYSVDGIMTCLDTDKRKNVLTDNNRIRRLTPTECERLQTVPDGFTSVVSDTQRYKMLGNGWTVDVIVHILSFLTK